MIAKFDLNKVIAKNELKATKALSVIGAAAVSHVTDQIRKNKSIVTSNLVNSITYSTREEQPQMSGDTDGKNLYKPIENSVKIGTTVVYAPRVEFGFTDKDSLGRQYNQPAKSFLRTALINNEKKLAKLFSLMMKSK